MEIETSKTEAEERDCFFCGPAQANQGSSSSKSGDQFEGKKWANCFHSLYKQDSHNENYLAEILEDASYCSSCVEEFEKLEDLLSQLENLRVQLDLIKLNYKTKLNRTLDTFKTCNSDGGFEERWRKRETVFEYMRERSGTDFSESRHELAVEPIVVLEEGNAEASLSGDESSDSGGFGVSDDNTSDEDYNDVPIRKKLCMEKRELPSRSNRKATTSPIPESLRSKHKLKDAVVKVERLPVSKTVSTVKRTPRQKGMKYKKSRECRTCELTFSTSAELKEHRKSHKSKGSKDVPCKVPDCNLLFENAIDRNAHIKVAHQDFKPFQCKFCLRSFRAKQTLQQHENSHTNAIPYSCVECGETFINRRRLHRHMRKHGGQRNFLCDKCEKAFFTIQDLQRHVRVHTNERPFICEFCGRSFTAAIYLRDHLPSHPESNLAKPLCKFCGKIFVSSVYLQDHEKTHVGDFKFWCDKCSFGATKKFKLDRHMLTHIETREFECIPCQKNYKSSLDLKTHNKLVHSNMDFICDTCNKVFTSRFYLLRHTKIHTSEKNFSCNICGYSFSVKRYLRAHMKKYHPLESSLKTSETVNNILVPEPTLSRPSS